MVQLKLKQLLKDKGLSQNSLARELGVSEMTVSSWVSGKRFPTVETLDRVATVLGIRFTELFQEPRRKSLRLQVRIGTRTIDLTPEVLMEAAISATQKIDKL